MLSELVPTPPEPEPVGVPAQAYLARAFERLGTHRDRHGLELHEMTPAAFKKTLAVLAD